MMLCKWMGKMKVILCVHKKNKYEALGMIREAVSQRGPCFLFGVSGPKPFLGYHLLLIILEF